MIARLMSPRFLGYGYGGFVEDFGISHWQLRGLSSLTNIVVLMLVMVMVFATLLTLAERKWSAFMQDRNRIEVADIGECGGRNLSGFRQQGFQRD